RVGARRSARVEGSGTEVFRAGLGDSFRDGVDLFVGLDRAWAGGDDNFGPADFYTAAEIDDRTLRFKGAAGEFEGLRDAHDFADAGGQFEVTGIEIAMHAHGAGNGGRGAGR